MRRSLVFILFFFTLHQSHGQFRGQGSFEFLNVPVGARVAGLGGVNVSLADKDVNLIFSNPALIGDTLAGVASASYQFYVADIGHAAIAYAHNFGKIGTLTLGVQHFNYGNIDGYDNTGMETDIFSAAETNLVVGKNHTIGNFRLGANLKGVFSSLAGFRSTAVALDLGGVFIHPEEDLTVGLAVRNLGVVLSHYAGSENVSLPFDVQLGTSFKPQHMPLRFSITAFNLTQRRLAGRDAEDEEDLLPEILKHVNFGGEILLHRNVNILVGYNYLNHRALKLENGGGGAGISLGLSLFVKKFNFVFGRMAYVAGSAAYSFTLSGNLGNLIRRQ